MFARASDPEGARPYAVTADGNPFSYQCFDMTSGVSTKGVHDKYTLWGGFSDYIQEVNPWLLAVDIVPRSRLMDGMVAPVPSTVQY